MPPCISSRTARELSCLRALQRPLLRQRKDTVCRIGMGWLPIVNSIFKGTAMKKGIHPEYMDCKVSCACGNEFTVRSNKPELSIDICNECHPFFTGSEKIVDAAGRVEKFRNKYKLS